ncbi:PepSY domain-containing protein [Caulobacter sp. 17J65-9]|uniref:PepSY domain-containing protein n=1 Tax=Caulobacter sp. 17J65-9 TaxID=2709382 RepID=UPI0013CAD071|nr:PepSY domain-containing protein [Caulobacter sp. 17J65-9]NEX91565.1 PepSY domain-containing protein [Caulobacter sp. 17J65-9]
MKVLRLSLQLHKWIGLVVGVQVLAWVAGGLIMTVLPIEKVRGEHHVADARPAPLDPSRLLSAADVARLAGVAPIDADLKSTPRGPVWVLKPASGEPVIRDAILGSALPPMDEEEVRTFARLAYKGDAHVVAVRLLAEAPQETGRTGALWRVDFDDLERTTFYLSPATAEVVTRRSGLWRFYDVFWRLHIMDLKTGENFNHPLIIAAAVLTLSIVVTGVILLWIRLARDLQQWRAAGRRTREARQPG